MQRGNGGRDDLFGGFGDPFAGFGGFGAPGNLISNFFGGRDPFDDPFFTRPFGSMLGSNMFGPSMLGSNMSGPSMFGRSMFGEQNNSGFIEAQPPQANRGPIIQELSSDDEEKQEGESTEEVRDAEGKKGSSRKHARSNKEPFVQEPDEEPKERRSRIAQYGIGNNGGDGVQKQARTFSFQSSTVTYGGANGAYYTSSTTRRTGDDGLTLEESKEADTTTRQASHRISRGIRDKGHSHTRKLNPDGRVETNQMLHNLNEDELAGFNEVWKGSAQKNFPGWTQGFDMLDGGVMSGGNTQHGQSSRGWVLPLTEQQQEPVRARWAPPPAGQPQERAKSHVNFRSSSFNRRA